MTNRRFLFLTGCPRSGTSAFSRLLNRHPDLVVGMERFKGFIKKDRIEQFGPHLFTEERFFRFEPDDTNQVPGKNASLRGHYALAGQKFSTALVVGDKVPAFTANLEYLSKNFPAPAIVIIVREVAAVANSWKRLGTTSKSKFFAGRQAKHGVISWNRAMARTANALAQPDPPFIVQYEQIFSGTYDFGPLMSYIGVPLKPEFLASYRDMIPQSKAVASRESLLDEQDLDYINTKADMALYRDVIARAA